jgi:threonylcarbamoyladenosine tRNA methylthiotransferase MtaB
MRVRLESIGCRLNIGEIEAISRELAAAGHRLVGPGEQADLCIFNSCAVTGVASRKSRQVLRQLRRTLPDARLVATGCLAELAPEGLNRLGVDLVVGNEDKDRMARLLADAGLLSEAEDAGEALLSSPQYPPTGHTRAFLKIQDGCDNSCTFCVVTLARGAGRSIPADRVLSELDSLSADGYQEVVLSGVHLGSYGHDMGDRHGLEKLVRRILSESEVPRLRLSSLEPWDLEEGFFELFGNSRLLPHLHLPLQSGCDATLRRMARRVDRAGFARLVAAARTATPEMSVSTDIIVGFPGEDDDEFQQSLDFVEEMAFSRLHVFRYSPRQGTRAAGMPRQTPGPEAQERSRRMRSLGARLETEFSRCFVGATAPVLWEQSEETGLRLRWSGLTPNYIRTVTETPADRELFNRVTETRILSTVPGGVLGSVDGVSAPGLIEASSRRALPVVQK